MCKMFKFIYIYIYLDDLFYIYFSNIYCCMVYLYGVLYLMGWFFSFFSYDEWRQTSPAT
jgi:hypothetical protein